MFVLIFFWLMIVLYYNGQCKHCISTFNNAISCLHRFAVQTPFEILLISISTVRSSDSAVQGLSKLDN